MPLEFPNPSLSQHAVVLVLGGHGSTEASRAAIAWSLRDAVTAEQAVDAHIEDAHIEDAPAAGSIEVVALGGPVPVDGGDAWWAVGDLRTPEADALVNHLDQVAARLGGDRVTDGTARLFAVGFSQGAAAALSWAGAAARVTPLHGVVSVAGFLPGIEPARTTLPPSLFVHTELDEVVDPFLSERAARRFRAAGSSTVEHALAVAHEWTDETSRVVAGWVIARFRAD